MRNRYVAVDENGRSGIRSGPVLTSRFEHTPGFETGTVWRTEPGAGRPLGDADPAPTLRSFHPAPGGTVFMTMTVPPDAVYADPGFDPIAAAAEAAAQSPGIAERMEPDAPGFHTTDTVDYVIVLDGEIVLRTDDDEAVVRAGDVIVQNGTRHAWSNRSDRAATLAIVLVGIAP